MEKRERKMAEAQTETTQTNQDPNAAIQGQAEEVEPETPDVQEPNASDPPRTEFAGIHEALSMGLETLRRMPQANPQRIKLFLINDLYPILIDMAQMADWYTGNLHDRVSTVEEEVEGNIGEGISPELAEQLIEFIGHSLQVFGVVVNVAKDNQNLIHTVQLLVAKAPGLINRIQEITITDEEDEEEEEEDEPEVIEPAADELPEESSATEKPQVEAESTPEAAAAESTPEEATPAEEAEVPAEESAPAEEPVKEETPDQEVNNA
jgi:hypothetical protein